MSEEFTEPLVLDGPLLLEAPRPMLLLPERAESLLLPPDDGGADEDDYDDSDEASGDGFAPPVPEPVPPFELTFESEDWDPPADCVDLDVFKISARGPVYAKMAHITRIGALKWEMDEAPIGSVYPPQAVVHDEWNRKLNVETVTMNRDRLPSVGMAHSLFNPSSGVTPRGDGTYTFEGGIPEDTTYGFIAYFPRPLPSQLRAATTSVPSQKSVSLYGYRPPQRIRELANQLKGADLFEFIQNAKDWLAENTEYVSNPEHDDVDAIDYFLFESQEGFCQHYAAALVLLGRILSYPCRVVVGYHITTPDPFGMVAKGSDAHAWTEFYTDEFGWITFDPTPVESRPQEDEDGTEDAEPVQIEVVEDTDGKGTELDQSVPFDADIPLDEELVELDPEDYEPEPEPETLYREFKDVEDWARAFAREAKRLLVKAMKPRYAGNFETGGRLNTAGLYRVATGDPRLYHRRKRQTYEPVRFLFAYDESGSIKFFRGEQRLAWARARWMLAEGLARCDQEFGVLGFARTLEWYKHFSDPFGEETRRRLIEDANTRLGDTRHNGATKTFDAVEAMRKEHEAHDPRRTTYGFILTDGIPTGHPVMLGTSKGESHIDWARKATRAQIELAHSENLHIIGLVMPEINSEDEVLKGLDTMFDRSMVLSPNRKDLDEQMLGAMMQIFRRL